MKIIITENQLRSLITNIINEQEKDDKYWRDRLDRRFYAEQFIWDLYPDKPEDEYIKYFNKDFTELYLSYNKLTTLPDTIGNLSQLKELYLFYNNLTTLPDTIGNLSQLNVLYIDNNNLSKQEQDKIRRLLPNTKIIF